MTLEDKLAARKELTDDDKFELRWMLNKELERLHEQMFNIKGISYDDTGRLTTSGYLHGYYVGKIEAAEKLRNKLK